MEVLSIKGLTKKFGTLTAVDELDLTVEKGNVYGILGPNGSGKSTTLGMILKVVNPTAGSWRWFGQSDHSYAIQKIGAILESPKFYPYLSASKNLQIVAKIKGVAQENIDESLALVGLFERKNDLYNTFSLGMKQRLAIASAMLNKPEVLILDEPTNGLDPEGIIQIREIIRDIASRGVTILLASHLLDEVEKVCSHVIVLNKGKTVYSGSVQGMTQDNDLIELAADDMNHLETVLQDTPFFSSYVLENGLFLAILNEEINAATVNRYFYEKDIVLSHLKKKKPSLESQFFTLLKKQ